MRQDPAKESHGSILTVTVELNHQAAESEWETQGEASRFITVRTFPSRISLPTPILREMTPGTTGFLLPYYLSRMNLGFDRVQVGAVQCCHLAAVGSPKS